MDRKDADYNLKKLKGFKHNAIEAYKHTAKVLEYILYELDGLKNREAEAPSIFGSYVEEPNYDDYEEDDDDADDVELPDIDESYIDDTNVPMVLASNALLTPFRVVKEEPDAKTKEEPDETVPEENKKVEEVPEGSSGTVSNHEVQFSITKDLNEVKEPKPKRLRVVGETHKDSLHTDSLSRVKKHLRAIKKKKSKKK